MLYKCRNSRCLIKLNFSIFPISQFSNLLFELYVNYLEIEMKYFKDLMKHCELCLACMTYKTLDRAFL